MIETTELAPDLTVSRVLTALWPLAGLDGNGALPGPVLTANELIPRIEAGYTCFDTAEDPGSAEVITGLMRSAEAPRPKVQILAHWVPTPGTLSRQEVRKAVERILDRLKIDRLDLLQYHAWNYSDPVWLDSLFWLEELRDEGMIGHLGLNDFDAPHLSMALASGITIRTNQICYSLLDQRAAADMRGICEHYGVKILAYGSLAGGLLSENWLGKAEPKKGKLTGWALENYRRLIALAGDWSEFQNLLKVLNQVAEKHRVSIAAVSSRYVLDQPGFAGIILGAGSDGLDSAQEYTPIFTTELDRDDHDSILRAQSHLDAAPGESVDECGKHPLLTAAGDSSIHPQTAKPVYPVIRKDNGKTKVLSGAVWENIAGYCRATRSGRRILVSGTTAVHGERLIGGEDPAAQTHFVIDKIQAAIESLGGRLEDVDRTRIFVKDIRDWEQVTRVHGERFGHIQPVTTLVQAKLIDEEYLVEIEAEARVV